MKWEYDDYIHDHNDEDEWSINPKWKVLQSIAFINNCPVVMTCLDHNNETSEMMIYLCRWKYSLSADQPDQIAQIALKSFTVKKVKASQYSTE